VRLPNGDHAIIETAKLTEYCLNPHHFRGRHKARVFLSLLGLDQHQAGILRDALRTAARQGDARPGLADDYGNRYIIDFAMTHGDKTAIVRSTWIIRSGELQPRLVTCFVKLGGERNVET
jgi:hypothetical protein